MHCYTEQKMPPRRRSQRDQDSEDEHRGPNQNSLQQIVDLLVGALQGRIQNLNPLAPQITTFKDFKNVGPSEFKGTTEPVEARAWIKEIEKVFVIARVGEDQKTVFATYMIKREANFFQQANQNRVRE